MIFLKRRALMTRAGFNYKTVSGIGSIVLENCVETKFKRLMLFGNSAQGENPSIESPKEIKNSGKYDEVSGKYVIDVGVTGKNLIDVDELRNENGYLKSRFTSSTKIKPFHIEKDKKYLLFGVGRGCDYSSVYFGDSSLKYGGNNYDWLHTGTGFKIFDSDKEKYIALTAKRSATITNVIIHGSKEVIDCYTVKKFGLFELMDGETSVQYEPYHEPQTVRLQLEKPLTKWDRLEKQDGVYGVVYTSKHVIFDGGAEEEWIRGSTGKSFYLKGFTGLEKSYEIFCDKLKNYKGSPNEMTQNSILGNTTDLRVSIDGITDVETLRTWLSKNNLDVYYFSKESEFVPFPEETQLALENLHANDGTTVINVDSGEVGTGIEVEYAVKE